MNSISRNVAAVITGVVVAFLTAGVAEAAPVAAESTPIWLLPGVDLGPVLDLTIQLPTQLLRPVFGLLP